MLFTLAFDHRNSLLAQFFGVTGEPTTDEKLRCREAKAVIYEGLLAGLRDGLPRGRAAILVDDEYGADIVVRAREAGVVVAIPLEKSGRRELAFAHDPFQTALERLKPDYAKILVRYNPEADAAMNIRQRDRLLLVQRWLAAHDGALMLELLVPAEEAQLASVGGDASRYDAELRPSLTVKAVRELVAYGLAPQLWKLEGMSSSGDYAAVADAAVTSRGPDTGCLVLGRGADSAAVDRWLTLAAPVPGFVGFAVGRTIWWEPLQTYFRGALPREAAAEVIGTNYRRLIDVYLTALDQADEKRQA